MQLHTASPVPHTPMHHNYISFHVFLVLFCLFVCLLDVCLSNWSHGPSDVGYRSPCIPVWNDPWPDDVHLHRTTRMVRRGSCWRATVCLRLGTQPGFNRRLKETVRGGEINVGSVHAILDQFHPNWVRLTVNFRFRLGRNIVEGEYLNYFLKTYITKFIILRGRLVSQHNCNQ